MNKMDAISVQSIYKQEENNEMKRKLVIAMALVIALSGGVAATTAVVSHAADLTMATDASQVVYGTLTKKQAAMVEKLFDEKFYAEKNEDVVKALGTERNALLEHFEKCGIWEGRKGWRDFDPSAYASAYPDLKSAFGNDIIKYYEHYYTFGQKEGRNLTTLAACSKAGVKVASLFNDQLTSVEIYAASNLMGTRDYSTVAAAVSSASSSSSSSSVSTSSGNYVISNEPIVEKKGDFTELGTFVAENGATIYIYKINGVYSVSRGDDNPHVKYPGTVIEFETADTDDLKEMYSRQEAEGKADVTGPLHDENLHGIVVGEMAITDDRYSEPIPSDEVAGEYTGKMNHHYSDSDESYTIEYSIDPNGSSTSEYNLGAYVKNNDDGSAQITTKVSSESGYNYEVTYTINIPDETEEQNNAQ